MCLQPCLSQASSTLCGCTPSPTAKPSKTLLDWLQKVISCGFSKTIHQLSTTLTPTFLCSFTFSFQSVCLTTQNVTVSIKTAIPVSHYLGSYAIIMHTIELQPTSAHPAIGLWPTLDPLMILLGFPVGPALFSFVGLAPDEHKFPIVPSARRLHHHPPTLYQLWGHVVASDVQLCLQLSSKCEA